MLIWIKNWISEIIVAVIISIIIEMLVPEGKNKKYVKVVSGIYILYTIINPILNSLEFKMENFYISSNTINVNSESVVAETYLKSLENYLKEEIEKLNYKVKYIELMTNLGFTDIVQIKIGMELDIYDEEEIKNVILKEIDIDKESIIIE